MNNIKKVRTEGVEKESINLKSFMTRYGLMIIIIVFILIMCIVQPAFRTSANMLNILKQVSMNGMIALGMAFVIMIGGIDLSVGSIVAVATLVAGSVLTMNPDNQMFTVYAVLAALAAGILCGAFNGLCIAYLKIPPFIVTMGTMTMFRGLGYLYCNGQPYVLKSATYKVIGQGTVTGLSIPIPAIMLVVAIVIFYFILNWTKFGRNVLATGGNENAAITAGINVKKMKIIVYTMCGFMAALGGIILGSRINAGNPSLGSGYELDAISAVVIGGASMSGGLCTTLGTVLGIMTLGLINNSLNMLGVSSYFQMVFQGIIIIVAVALDARSRQAK